MMTFTKYHSGILLAVVLAVFHPNSTAQTWKPICVNGSNTTGVHNSTWQKINTATSGGTSWKKVGECIAPPPPPPPPPPAGPPPFQGASINTWIVAENIKPKPATATFMLKADGTWDTAWASGGRLARGTRNGRWLSIGNSANDFEMMWRTEYNSEAGYDPMYVMPYTVQADSQEGVYYPLSMGWTIKLTSLGADCYNYNHYKVSVHIRKRSDPSVQFLSEMIYLQAASIQVNGCG